MLTDKDLDVRHNAAGSLGWLRDPRAVDPLIHMLTDKDLDARRHAAESLGRLQDPRAIEPLVQALADNSFEVQGVVTASLTALRDVRVVKPLLKALGGANPFFVHHAMMVLDKLPITAVTAQLASVDVQIRRMAARALHELFERGVPSRRVDPRALTPLVHALTDSDSEVRRSAADALGTMKDAQAADALSHALLDVNAEVRFAAATSLCALGDPRGEDFALRRLSSWDDGGDDVTWHRRILALARLDTPRVQYALKLYLSGRSSMKRAVVVEALAQNRGPIERALLSRDCDGIQPWIDPREPITRDRVAACAARLKLSPDAVQAHYEALAPAFSLRLTWT